MATHSSVLAWRLPGTGKPGGLPSMGSHRVGHDWSDVAAAAAVAIMPLLLVFSPRHQGRDFLPCSHPGAQCLIVILERDQGRLPGDSNYRAEGQETLRAGGIAWSRDRGRPTEDAETPAERGKRLDLVWGEGQRSVRRTPTSQISINRI